ncbi:MAG TPA: hypothetical protein VFI38_07000 [Candidatus Acidoferrum sp.]|nr:hypothetical protein [Candidatus Acidoferrum sp.]
MRVRCISTYPSEEQIQRLGKSFFRDQAFHIEVGKDYIVLGLAFSAGSNIPFISVVGQYGKLGHAPLSLFEVIDARVSKYWEVRVMRNGVLVFWPHSFFREFYHDDLSELVPEVVADFDHVRAMMEAEASEQPAGCPGN